MSDNPAILQAYRAIAERDRAAGHDASGRKSAGITYTPPNIARSMVALLAPNENETLLEPSCGRGVFLVALVDYWLDQGRAAEWVNDWARDHLRAGDMDGDAIADALDIWRTLMLALGVAQPHPLNARVMDGLGWGVSQDVDAIIGNPPYVRFQNLPTKLRERLAKDYSSCGRGNVDLYYAFIEDALRRAKRVCYITPNSWMANASAKTLRGLLQPRLHRLIDFQARLVFAPVRAYTAIFLAGTETSDDVQVRHSLPEEPGEWFPYSRKAPVWTAARFAPVSTTATAGSHQQLLGDRAEVVSGIATLADHAFLLESPTVVTDEQGKRWIEQNDPLHPGHSLRIPEAFAPRLVKLTRPVWGETGPRILYPYRQDGSLVSEALLKQEAPDLLDWLQRRRDVLDQRDKGKTHLHEAWYAYGRRQGLWTAKRGNERLLAVPQMGRGRLVAHEVNTSSLGGRFLFTSGFLVRPQSEAQLGPLKATIESKEAWEFVTREGRAWAGTGDYRSLGARALRRLPVVE